ncbi:MAG TPA: nitrilase-related carbon-nitrogen hydrolase [Steroidobacteraceae bacterium]
MDAIACVILTSAACYCSFGLGQAWWLAWFTPIPVLWLVFGPTKAWRSFLLTWIAFALGLTSLLRAYVHVIPGLLLAFNILVPSVLFALAALGARHVMGTFGSTPAMFAFAALWGGFDLLLSLDPGAGSLLSPAGAEVGAPLLIQSASLVGFVGITFLLGAVAAGVALSLRTRNPAPALLAAGLFAANAMYGYWRVSHSPAGILRVALIDSNTYGYWTDFHQPAANLEAGALRVIDAYTEQIDRLRGEHVQLVVLPENISMVSREWRGRAEERLGAAANATGATIVGGFNMYVDGARRNVAWAFIPRGQTPVIYEKRQLVPGFESSLFTPGSGPRVLPDGIGLEICFDMNFQRMIRRDQAATRPRMLAVLASEIGTHGDWSSPGPAADAWFHARDAVLRSVENGVPMARSAVRGLLTLNDRYGYIIAQRRTNGEFTTLIGDLRLEKVGGTTVYDRIGDAFGWGCLALGVGLVGASLLQNLHRSRR